MKFKKWHKEEAEILEDWQMIWRFFLGKKKPSESGLSQIYF